MAPGKRPRPKRPRLLVAIPTVPVVAEHVDAPFPYTRDAEPRARSPHPWAALELDPPYRAWSPIDDATLGLFDDDGGADGPSSGPSSGPSNGPRRLASPEWACMRTVELEVPMHRLGQDWFNVEVECDRAALLEDLDALDSVDLVDFIE
jgi:hypothetical protein